MVDGVELVLRDQALQMRELERDDTLRLEQALHAGDEVVEVGHLRQHVVADDEVGLLALGGEPLGKRRAEELDQRRHAALRAASATLAAGSMPSTGTPSGRKCCSR